MEFINCDGEIPASEWFKLIIPIMREGYGLKICPKGFSMIPFLVGGRDEAVLSLPDDGYKFKKNDIVLYQAKNGVYVLHRIYSINENGIYTMGDSQTVTDGPYQQNDIIAIVDYIIRKGKKIESSNRAYIWAVSVWRVLRPFRMIIIKTHTKILRLIR